MGKAAKTLNQTDSLTVHVGVQDDRRRDICEKLSGFLASTYVLYLKTLYYHWNVTGANFVGLHKLFEEQYNALHTAGDELAERIRALGHFTPGTVREFTALSSIKDDDKLPGSAKEMVQHLLEANEECSREARSVMEIAEASGDEVTVDMMIQRMNFHDKTAWMLRSVLE